MNKENKPSYRFKFSIVDENNDVPVITGSSYVSEIDSNGSCESVELEVFSALRAFEKAKEAHEKKFYWETCSVCYETFAPEDFISEAGVCKADYQDLMESQKQEWAYPLI